MITGWGCLTITTGCGYRRGGGGRLPMSTRPYTPGWISPWMLTPTPTSAACTSAGPAARRPAAIKGTVLFMSLSPEKTFHDALKAPRPATVRLSPTGDRKMGDGHETLRRALPGRRSRAGAWIFWDAMRAQGALECGRARGALRTRLKRELAEQGRNILRAIDCPQILKNGAGPLLRPAPAHVAAELLFDFGPVYRPPREARHVVDLARNALPVGEDRGHARRNHRSDARREGRILLHRDLSHEGEDARLAELRRRVAVVRDIAVEHGARGDIGQAVIGGFAGVRRPLLGLAPGALVAPPRRRDFDRGDAIEGAQFPRDLDAGHDRGLRVDHGRISFHPALVDAKRHPAAAECADVDLRRPGDLLEETRIALEDGRRAGQACAREQSREHGVPPGFGVGEPLPVRQRLDPGLRHRH